jgi:peptide subunit release factor 1 (eRF1)
MSEVRLTIEEVIDHCERKVESFKQIDTDHLMEKYGKESRLVKEYLEHKQVAEWLRELLKYRAAKIAVPFKNKDNCSFWTCPVCNSELYWDTDFGQQKFKHCTECGIELDWKSAESENK